MHYCPGVIISDVKKAQRKFYVFSESPWTTSKIFKMPTMLITSLTAFPSSLKNTDTLSNNFLSFEYFSKIYYVNDGATFDDYCKYIEYNIQYAKDYPIKLYKCTVSTLEKSFYFDVLKQFPYTTSKGLLKLINVFSLLKDAEHFK